MKKPSKILKQLYARIPTFKCVDGCNECCGPVAMIKPERKKLGLKTDITRTDDTLTCQFSTVNGCSVYKDRPLTCRLFGTVERLPCKHGCKPDKMLTKAEEDQIMEEYFKCK